ncbi:hypothetical protein BDD12DRAFT_877818 [Trichophaea hybrida]|nr:hypothetical protein BDD12DRAFT_877818 [Trichophaea hybrida]
MHGGLQNDELVCIDLDEAVQQFNESITSRIPGQPSEGNVRLSPGTQHLSPEPSKNFVSLLLEFLKGQETRSSKLQSKFQKQLLEVHRGWNEHRARVFCLVVGRFIDPERVKAAHIYPFVLGTTVMRMTFGEPAVGELFHVCNGLLLADSIETCFDKHQVVIVPANRAKLQAYRTIDRWVLKPVDDAVKNIPMSDVNGTFADLHVRALEFRTTACPAARYLYFHYLLAMLQMGKHGCKFFRRQKTDDHGDIDSRPVPWVTPGIYIQERMVCALIAEAGQDVFQEREFDQIAIPDNNPPGIEEKALAVHLVALPPSELDENSY